MHRPSMRAAERDDPHGGIERCGVRAGLVIHRERNRVAAACEPRGQERENALGASALERVDVD